MKKYICNQLTTLLLLLMVSLAACQGAAGEKNNKKTALSIPSDEVRVIKKWDLPVELKEISGLSYIDQHLLACVEDETGTVYVYNITDEKIERKISFGGMGDYEGLAVVGNDIWVLRADGQLFEIKNSQTTSPAVNKYNTLLTAKQDCEGLCYDSAANRLLITVKEKDPNSTEYKGIYAFNLSDKLMAGEPLYKLNLSDETLTAVSDTKKKKKNAATISPSGIAIHPVSGDLYITDGPKSRLLITDAGGNIKKLLQLDSKVFAQPEGIIFNQSGELFISNEGPKQPGNILQVELRETK